MTQEDEERQLAHVRDDLVAEFEGRLTRRQVEERFTAIVRDFDAAPVRTFVPLLAKRAARRQLADAPG